MFPDVPQNQPGTSANLPMIPQQTQPTVSGQALPPTAGTSASVTQVGLQAKQLVAQYGNDPFRLSAALEQLKSNYLAEQYHIIPNSAEN